MKNTPAMNAQMISEKAYGRFGDAKKQYLMENQKETWDAMLADGSLDPFLTTFQQEMEEKADRMETQMLQKEGVTETLKRQDPIAYIQRYNNLRSRILRGRITRR